MTNGPKRVNVAITVPKKYYDKNLMNFELYFCKRIETYGELNYRKE